METPAKFTFSPDGNTNVFQIPVSMKGDNYVRIDINNTTLNDRTKFDLVNNAVVFVSKADVPAGSKLDIFVVQTDEGIANLGAVNSIDIVATNITTVNSVATSIASVNTAAANLAAIIAAPTHAATAQASEANATAQAAASAQASADATTAKNAAASSASSASASAAAASASATAAAASATAAAASLDAFDDTYLGAKATNPTVDNDGDPLKVGAQYFNTTNNELLIWTGSAWQGAGTIGGTVASLGISGDLTIADKIVHSGDTNTAIRFPAADTVTVETSGAERLRVTSTGNVGIGTVSPAFPLEVKASSGNRVRFGDGTNNLDFFPTTGQISSGGDVLLKAFGASGIVSFSTGTGAPERLRIDSSGNVGVGSTNPQAALDLAEGAQGRGITWAGPSGTARYNSIFSSYSGASLVLSSLFHGSTSADSYVTSHTGTTRAAGIRLNWTNNNGIQFFTDAAASKTAGDAFVPSERMRIDASGNVGVGIVSPATKMHVSGGNGNQIRYTGATDSVAMGVSTVPFVGSVTNAPMTFLTNAAERMRIDSGGNVGIGTSSPAKLLSIRQPADNNGIRISHASRAPSTFWEVELSGVNNEGLAFKQNDGSTTVNSYVAVRDRHLFYTGGTERMRIESSGAIGIGGTNYGTSGQVLKSQGSGAAPVWANPSAMTRLGSVVPTATSAVTFSGLTLTGYSTLFVLYNGIKCSTASVNPRIAGQIFANSTTSAADMWSGIMIIDLSDGNAASSIMVAASSTAPAVTWTVPNTGITTASTSVSFNFTSGNFVAAGRIMLFGA